jgi:hypothetical protein
MRVSAAARYSVGISPYVTGKRKGVPFPSSSFFVFRSSFRLALFSNLLDPAVAKSGISFESHGPLTNR